MRLGIRYPHAPTLQTLARCLPTLLLLSWTPVRANLPVREEPPPHEIIVVGWSVEHAPIKLEVFGDGPQHVLVVGGMHGNEPSGAEIARRLAKTLDEHSELLRDRTVAIVAEVNPDGLRRMSRCNAHGVDLNRNFPSEDWQPAPDGSDRHGPSPASEPETLAVMRAVILIKPDRIIDIHSITGSRHCNNYDGPGRALADLMSTLNGYQVAPSIGYPTPGCIGSWTGIDDGIPTITLELPRGAGATRCWRENADALLAFVSGECQPAISGATSTVHPASDAEARRHTGGRPSSARGGRVRIGSAVSHPRLSSADSGVGRYRSLFQGGLQGGTVPFGPRPSPSPSLEGRGGLAAGRGGWLPYQVCLLY